MADDNEIQLDGTVPVDKRGDAGRDSQLGDGDRPPDGIGDGSTKSDDDSKPDTLNTQIEDLPESNAPNKQDQSKVTGAPESKDYGKNPPRRPATVTSTNDRDSVHTGPESIGAGGLGDTKPGPGTGDGLDSRPLGDPDAPQGTGPDVNSKTLGQRDAVKAQGEVRQSRAVSEK